MKFTVDRDVLLKPLNLVAGVVERRQTLPILANVMLSVEDGKLSLTGTDLEVELQGAVILDQAHQSGDVTVPGKKLADICKSLPDGAVIDFSFEGDKATIKSGKSRFTLAPLPAVDFPLMETGSSSIHVELNQFDLKKLISRAGFAMAQQDVRYYLNGMLWEIGTEKLRLVATDGHRLALSELAGINSNGEKQVILPRKAVLEVARLMVDADDTVKIELGDTHFKAVTKEFVFSSKLVDGKFPEYTRVIPQHSDKFIVADKGLLKDALSRTAILSNEKFRGVRMRLESGQVLLQANNPEQEEAQESFEVDYGGESLEIGFNVGYLLDVLSALDETDVQLALSDANSSCLIEAIADESEGAVTSTAQYVVMPMRL